MHFVYSEKIDLIYLSNDYFNKLLCSLDKITNVSLSIIFLNIVFLCTKIVEP